MVQYENIYAMMANLVPSCNEEVWGFNVASTKRLALIVGEMVATKGLWKGQGLSLVPIWIWQKFRTTLPYFFAIFHKFRLHLSMQSNQCVHITILSLYKVWSKHFIILFYLDLKVFLDLKFTNSFGSHCCKFSWSCCFLWNCYFRVT